MIHEDTPDTTTLLNILQISDSVFPTGGFSHSLGFESADKHYLIKNREDYENFLYCTLENAASLSIPFLREGHSQYEDLKKLVDLDKACEACLSNHVANRASAKQGRSLIDAASQTCPDNLAIQNVHDAIMNCRISGHHAPLYGALFASLGIGVDSAVTSFMYMALKTVVTSSVRLGSMGTMEGQRIQHRVQKQIPEIIGRARDLTTADVHIRFPVADVCQNIHDTMFSKLFYS